MPELEQQLSEKNAITEFLPAQIIAKPTDTTSLCCSDNYCQRTNDVYKSNHNDLFLEKLNNDGTKKEVTIIGDYSILNNVNGRRSLKSKKIKVLNFSGATSTNIC